MLDVLLYVWPIYSILLTLVTFILITYIIRLRRHSVCRKCKIALKSNIESEKTGQPKLCFEFQDDNKNLSPDKTRKKFALPDAEVPSEIHHYEEIMDWIKNQQPELYDRVLQKAIRDSMKIDNQLWQSDSRDQVQCSHTYEKIIYNKPENAYDILLNSPQRITNYNLKDLQPSSSKNSQDKINSTSKKVKQLPTKDCPQKVVHDSEVVPLKSNVEPVITVQRKFNLEFENINEKKSPQKIRKKLPEPPLKIHHYEEIMDRIKTQQPELYEQVLEPLQRTIRESINIDNKTDRVQCSDMPRSTYEEEIDNNFDNAYDIFVHFPKRIPNPNLKDLQQTSSETNQRKINEISYLEAASTNHSEVVPSKSNIKPEITVQRKSEKTSSLKTRKKLALHPKTCRKKRDEMEVPSEVHPYEKIKDTEKARQSELTYETVIDQLQTTLGESTNTDDLKQTEAQYFDMLSHTYEKVIYNKPEKAHYQTPKRSISFRSSFGMKDHLKYLQPSSSHTSEDDINETTYLEAKQFIPTEDCPQKLRSLCDLQNRMEEKATPWLPPSRIRTQSESRMPSKGFFDLFLKMKK